MKKKLLPCLMLMVAVTGWLPLALADVFKLPVPGSSLANRFHTRIIDGTPVARTSIPVVQISIASPDGTYLCSGTMVASDVVLTASHCVTKRPSEHIVNLKGRRYSVARVRVHPYAREAADGSIINDVALLYLRRNPRSDYFPIITSRKAQPGDSMFIYGYGLDENQRAGNLRTGTMKIASTNARWVYANFTGQGDSNTCDGDSGGPAFGVYTDRQGMQYLGLIAATAGGYRADCAVGDESYFTNLQATSMVKFLRSNIRSLARR
jgi:V8-like Glu-specific endopeptidase